MNIINAAHILLKTHKPLKNLALKLIGLISFAYLSVVCINLALMNNAYAAQYKAYVEFVVDGDTVKIRQNGRQYKLRLNEIDAPELSQPSGKLARRAVIQLCINQPIKFEIIGTDKYQRQLGYLQCNQTNINQYLVENGLAWHYKQYSDSRYLAQAELNAQQNRLGLWQEPNPIPPWIWRRSHQYTHKNSFWHSFKILTNF